MREKQGNVCNQKNIEQTLPTIIPVHKSTQVEMQVATAMKYSMLWNSFKQVLRPRNTMVILELNETQPLKGTKGCGVRFHREVPGSGSTVPAARQPRDLPKPLGWVQTALPRHTRKAQATQVTTAPIIAYVTT